MPRCALVCFLLPSCAYFLFMNNPPPCKLQPHLNLLLHAMMYEGPHSWSHMKSQQKEGHIKTFCRGKRHMILGDFLRLVPLRIWKKSKLQSCAAWAELYAQFFSWFLKLCTILYEFFSGLQSAHLITQESSKSSLTFPHFHTHITLIPLHPSLKPATSMAFLTIFTIPLPSHIHSFSMKLYSLISFPFLPLITKSQSHFTSSKIQLNSASWPCWTSANWGFFSVNKNLNFLVVINRSGHVKKESRRRIGGHFQQSTWGWVPRHYKAS